MYGQKLDEPSTCSRDLSLVSQIIGQSLQPTKRLGGFMCPHRTCWVCSPQRSPYLDWLTQKSLRCEVPKKKKGGSVYCRCPLPSSFYFLTIPPKAAAWLRVEVQSIGGRRGRKWRQWWKEGRETLLTCWLCSLMRVYTTLESFPGLPVTPSFLSPLCPKLFIRAWHDCSSWNCY